MLVDPRRTMTADIADMHLAIAPDGDVALFTGLLAYLGQHNALDRAYITEHTTGFGQALFAASNLDLAGLAEATGLSEDELGRFYSLFAATAKTVTVYSQGVNQSSSGTDKVNAIINCHLATGRIGKPGAGPFSVTASPTPWAAARSAAWPTCSLPIWRSKTPRIERACAASGTRLLWPNNPV
ncbi:hypothetical protein AJ88_07075 [Mesorhizobium amorphae CCBAU 01583]|nr:hypothetical protein AJ88_07075 [Mesorhizobium amorphae CCBAU 01583]